MPTLMDGKLMYQIECPPKYQSDAPTKRWVAASVVTPSAEGDWEYGQWDTSTEAFIEIDDVVQEGPT